MDMPRSAGEARPASIAASGISVRQSLAFIAFGAVYYLLAAYAAALPIQARTPLFIWPAHGVALGTLLVAPGRRWPAYLALVVVATVAVGMDGGVAWQQMLAASVVNVAEPLLVALGLQRLGGPRVQIDTLKGLASFLVGMVPLVAAMAIADSLYSYARFEAPLRQIWAVTFISTMLGMLLTAPLILAWSRKGWEDAVRLGRERMPELVVLYLGLIVTTNYVFSARPEGSGFVPPLAYLSAPFLVWAALRFGLRAATLSLAIFGLICYGHTGQGFGPFSIDGVADVRSLLHLQFYLATIIVTTLFSAALLVERQDAVRETEAWRNRHERVIRASGSLLYELDPRTGVVLWGGDVPMVLGTTPDKVTSTRGWMARVHPDDRIRLKGVKRMLLDREISNLAIEYRFHKDDGEYVTVGVTAYVVGKDPATRSIIGFVRDISEKVAAEQERARLEAQLRQAEKMQAVGHLAGGIAHDFNNILGAILGYGELAQQRAGQGDLRRYLDTIMDAGNRAKSLVNQILSYSRAEGTDMTPVLVTPIAQEACELLKGSSTHTVDVRFHAGEGDAVVRGDATRIHQLVMNLCTNAIQAMGDGGTLDVSVEIERVREPRKVRVGDLEPGEYVRIQVRDSGHGIAPEVIERIFEPFFTTKRAGHGTGLGLALVHAVVSEHQGCIDVESDLGRGTTFTVWIPRLAAEEGGRASSGPEASYPMGDGQVVLAVDDEPEVLAALEEMLATLGYEPVGFRNSKEALAAVQADPQRFDAVVSDEVMPEMSGTQLATQLRKVDPTLPILIASGYGGSGFETRALAVGVNRVLRKPYRMADIAEVLAGFFGRA